ncbi:MAG: hypothetical protein AAGE01_03530 [Pseudomonadota bacterium]
MPLSPLGIVHTLLGIGALLAVAVLLWQDKQIRLERPLARFYLLATILTAASALGIFRHGGANAAHGLAVLTILAVGAGVVATRVSFLGRLQKYAVALCFSATVLFHLLPTATEILTRFPVGSPLAGSLHDPLLQQTFGAIGLVFLIMLALQLNWLRAHEG